MAANATVSKCDVKTRRWCPVVLPNRNVLSLRATRGRGDRHKRESELSLWRRLVVLAFYVFSTLRRNADE
jgi:hypothetical protein